MPSRRNRMLAAARRYASGPLARVLGAGGRPARVEPAAQGVRSLVYFVEFDGIPRAVLRAVPRALDAWKLVYNLRHLAPTAAPVPRLLAAGRSPLARLRWGFWPVVEEWIEGRPAVGPARDEATVRAVAATLARLHNLERSRWGGPWLPRWTSYARHFLGRMAGRAGEVDLALARPRGAELGRWCREQAAAAPLGPPFSLTHSRVQPANFIVRPDGLAVAIDLLECRYGTFAVDLPRALERICGGEPEASDWFLETYFGLRPARSREAFERSRAFFEADFQLGRASRFARRVRRSTKAGREPGRSLDALRLHVARLAAITGVDMAVAAP